MKAAGADGFEGFVGVLLGALLDQTFLTARTGEQPGGDGRSFDGSIRFQTKHYTTAGIPDFDIVADFHRVRANYPAMETYVLGSVSEINEQLRSTLDNLQLEFGIDIVALDYETDASPLSVLTMLFWDRVQRFAPLNRLDGPTVTWIQTQSQAIAVQNEITRLREAFTQSVWLFNKLRTAANRRLQERFGRMAPLQPFRFTINLANGIPRTSLTAALGQWRNDPNGRLLLMQGDEGMGKSWAAAGFAEDLAREDGRAILWLDSHEWDGASDMQDLLRRALAKLPIDGIKDLTHWRRKAEFVWPQRLTLFLDGANEGTALKTAQKLVSDLRWYRQPKPRLVLTSRFLNRLHGYEEAIWRNVTICPVGPYDDAEFNITLAALRPPLRREDIPPGLGQWARIPRLLQTCARLRDQFGGLDRVTREMVLWADLLDRINQTDPQVRQTLGFRRDESAALVLSRLAQEFLATQRRDVGQGVLSECFGNNLQDVLTALEELRLAENAERMRTTVSRQANLLGLALVIRDRLRLPPALSTRGQADEFRRFLEPLAEVDERTQGLYGALQLTAMWPPEDLTYLQKQRAALLLAWATSHNADVSPSRLAFWAQRDVLAYADFVEALFEEPLEESDIELVISSLAERWRDDQPTRTKLFPVLQKWLSFIWPDAEGVLQNEVEREGHKLPVAANPYQLMLTLAALKIISYRPITDLLLPLVISRATMEHSFQTRMVPMTPAQGADLKPYKLPLKSWEANFGALMRFGFTEAVLPDLRRLYDQHRDGVVIVRGIQQLVASLRLVELPAELRLQPNQPAFQWKGVPALTLIREKRRLFPENPEDFHVQEYDFSSLAVREDLPDLLAEDEAVLIRRAANALGSGEVAMGERARTPADMVWEGSGAWLAKLDPGQLLELTSVYRVRAFNLNDPVYAFSLVETLLHQQQAIPTATLLQSARELWQRQPNPPSREASYVAYRLHNMAFLNFSLTELTEWLEYSAESEILRGAISHHPNSGFLRSVIPTEISTLARTRMQAHADEAPPAGEIASGHFDFWARLVFASAEPNQEMFDWAIANIRQLHPAGDRLFHWLCVLFAFAPADRLKAGFLDGTLREFFNKEGCNALWWIHRQLDPAWLAGIPVVELLRALPIGEVGKVLLGKGDKAGFQQWGLELLNRATALVGNPPGDRRYWGEFFLDFDRSGHVKARLVTPEPRPGKTPVFAPPVSPTLASLHADHTKETEEIQRLAGADCADIDNSNAAEMFDFGGLHPLAQWRQSHTDDFLRLAKPFLQRTLERPDRAHHLGTLIHAVLCNLLVVEPDPAFAFYQQFMNGGLRVQCRTVHKIPQFMAALWNCAECASNRHHELRREALKNATDEQSMMELMIAANANGGIGEAETLAFEFAAGAAAKDRGVGVSSLAWIGSKTVLDRLDAIQAQDPTRWLRRHAEWASEVNRQNQAAAGFYSRILTEDDPKTVSTMLPQLEAALTPLARYWRRSVEDKVLANRQLSAKVQALLTLFWKSWEYTESTKIEIAGRILREWRNGEEIRQLKAPRPTPF